MIAPVCALVKTKVSPPPPPIRVATFAPSAIVLASLLLPHAGDGVIGAVWTLRREVEFYLMFALAIADRRLGIAALATWQTAIAVNAVAPFFFAGPEPDMLLGVQNLGFGAGMAPAYVVRWRPLPVLGATVAAASRYSPRSPPSGVMAARSTSGASRCRLPSICPPLPRRIDADRRGHGGIGPAPAASAQAMVGHARRCVLRALSDAGARRIGRDPCAPAALPHVSSELLMVLLTAIDVAVAIAINRWLEQPCARWLRERMPDHRERAAAASGGSIR